MKRWIVKQFVHLSEISKRPVPGWIRGLVPQDELEAMESAEKDLTRALSRPRSDRPRMPDDLKQQLEEVARSTEPVRRPAESPFPTLRWAFAGAALLVLGSILLFRPPASWNPLPEKVPAVAEHTGDPASYPSSEEPKANETIPADDLDGDLLLKPLTAEQERLAMDVTNAVRYLADSFLPTAYALPVNEELQSARQRFMQSM